MRSEEAVGVLFVGRVVILLVGVIAAMASPDTVGAVALMCSLWVSAIFSTLFTSGQIKLGGDAARRALTTHYYIDVILAFGVVCVVLATYARSVLVALIIVGFLAKLAKPSLSFQTPRTAWYVLVSIAVVASSALGLLPWRKGDSVGVVIGALMVLTAAGAAVIGQWRTTRLLLRQPEPAPAPAPTP